MRKSYADYIGKKFGLWTILREVPPPIGVKYQRHVEARCDCGTLERLYFANVLRGLSRSCGCWRDKLTGERSTTHGRSRTKEHIAWLEIKRRCYNATTKSYPDYGGRGIKMSKLWRKDFARFVSDVGEAPSDSHTLGRIDNEGNYEPGNVQWETRKEQNNNTRRNHFLEHCGLRMTLAQWHQKTGIRATIIMKRLRRGWTIERALTEAPHR